MGGVTEMGESGSVAGMLRVCGERTESRALYCSSNRSEDWGSRCKCGWEYLPSLLVIFLGAIRKTPTVATHLTEKPSCWETYAAPKWLRLQSPVKLASAFHLRFNCSGGLGLGPLGAYTVLVPTTKGTIVTVQQSVLGSERFCKILV